MLKALEKKLRRVWFRCSINLLLMHTGWVLTAAGIIAVLTVLTERLLAFSVISAWTVWSFWGVGCLGKFLLDLFQNRFYSGPASL